MANRHEDLQTLLGKLKLSSMARSCSQLALKAAKEKLSHEAFLYELVRLECEDREQRRIDRYLSSSKLPREKTFRTFQWDRLTPALRLHVERLRTGRFVEQAHNVVAVGPPGVGLWTSTAALVQRLLVAKRELRLPQELARLDRIACLILDDIGYVQQDRQEMEVLFTLLAERYERRSVLITTNLVFSAWERIFKDPMTTLAAVDRVVHHAVILDMADISSFRATQARADQAAAESDPSSSSHLPGS